MSVLFLFTCILYCFAFLLLREAFLRMRIPSTLDNTHDMTQFQMVMASLLLWFRDMHIAKVSKLTLYVRN